MFKFFKLKINFGNNPFAFSTGSVCTAVPTSRVDSWRQNFPHRYGYHGENTFPWKGSSRFRMYFFVVLVIVIFVVVFLPSVYSAAPWVSKSTYPKKLVTVICHSLFHFDSSTFTFPTLLFQHHCSTITIPPLPFHLTLLPLLFHLTVPLWLFHHYRSITTVPL